MVIALDIDEVMADTLPCINTYYNNKHKTNYALKDYTTYHWWDVWGISVDKAIDEFCEFMSSPHALCIPPVHGAQNAIQQLSEENTLIAVTSRQEEFKTPTHTWVERTFPNQITEVYFGNEYSRGGHSVSKSTICKKIGAQQIVEDQIPHAIDCAQHGITVLLFDKKWNETPALPPKIHRVNSWDTILQELTHNHP